MWDLEDIPEHFYYATTDKGIFFTWKPLLDEGMIEASKKDLFWRPVKLRWYRKKWPRLQLTVDNFLPNRNYHLRVSHEGIAISNEFDSNIQHFGPRPKTECKTTRAVKIMESRILHAIHTNSDLSEACPDKVLLDSLLADLEKRGRIDRVFVVVGKNTPRPAPKQSSRPKRAKAKAKKRKRPASPCDYQQVANAILHLLEDRALAISALVKLTGWTTAQIRSVLYILAKDGRVEKVGERRRTVWRATKSRHMIAVAM
jgi:hypothetical protein